MNMRRLFVAALVLGVVGVVGYQTKDTWLGRNTGAKAAPPPRTVSVEVAKAVRQRVPVDVSAIGAVTPISSVALKSRIETTIIGVHFDDGARVKEGDLLFTLDARQIDAQIEQAEGALARDQAQLAGAQRDVNRFSELIGKGATTQVSLDNARTQADILIGTIKADQAALDNLKVQKSYPLVRAPFGRRISAANVKIGNLVRPADTAPLATINQMAPTYVAFAVPQGVLNDLRVSMANGTTKVIAKVPGSEASETGKVAFVENTVDATTGMVIVRAIMDNASEVLWPGTLVNTRLIVRTEDAVVVPSAAVQRSQNGDFVFVVDGGKAKVQPVKVARTSEGSSVLESGLNGDENVVTEGQLLLSDGTLVRPRERKAGA